MDPLHCLKRSRAGESLRGCFLFVLRVNVLLLDSKCGALYNTSAARRGNPAARDGIENNA